MKTVKITADVYSSDQNLTYRIFVDNTMMTERTVHWVSSESFVREVIIVHLDEGATHTVRLDNFRNVGVITMKNITVDGRQASNSFSV
jgi:hypothetical protein